MNTATVATCTPVAAPRAAPAGRRTAAPRVPGATRSAASTRSPVSTRLPTRTPLLERVRGMLAEAWRGWQARRRLAAELRALQALDEATLRDLGLAERVLRQQPTLGLHDYERGRW
jgi:uncharacterized protein YjiS (DUF1127 family)